jgi:hypothetical protein
MKFLKKAFAPKEVRAALGILDEAECRFDRDGLFDSDAFKLVRKFIEKALLAKPNDFVRLIQESGRTPRE